jgi:hypothetical protein
MAWRPAGCQHGCQHTRTSKHARLSRQSRHAPQSLPSYFRHDDRALSG